MLVHSVCEVCRQRWDGVRLEEHPTLQVCFPCYRATAYSLGRMVGESATREILHSPLSHPLSKLCLEGHLPIPGGSISATGYAYAKAYGEPQGLVNMNQSMTTEPTSSEREEVFRQQLERLNELIKEDPMHKLGDIELGAARGVVASVMADIQAHPELDSILIDRDIRNIIIFVKHTREVFTTQFTEKKETRAKTTAKKTAVAAGASAMMAAMQKSGFKLGAGGAAEAEPVKPKLRLPGRLATAESKELTAEEVADAFSVLPKGAAKSAAEVAKAIQEKNKATPVNDPLAAMRARFGGTK